MLALPLACLADGVSASASLTTLTSRLVAELLPQSPAEIARVNTEAQACAASLSVDGEWPDVDYKNQDRTNWAAAKHLDRVLTMIKAFRAPGGNLYNNKDLLNNARHALAVWLQTDPQNSNWWWNEIWAPQILGNIFALLGDLTTQEELTRGTAIMLRGKWTTWTGQNLVWGAGNQILCGCATHDVQVVAVAFARMAAEVRVAPESAAEHEVEGLQCDNSFYQHGRQLYSGGYGLGFARDCARFAALARDTDFAFPPEKLTLLSAYILDGSQWMVRGRTFDYSAVGREITRHGISAYGYAQACDDMAMIPGPRQGEFAAFARRIRRQPAPGDVELNGNRHFWRADLMTHHRAGYYFSVRLTSSRLRKSELINNEGKKSHYLADGATYLLRSGDEYRDIFPVWDWQRVPGTTVLCEPMPLQASTINAFGAQRFAGGVSDGHVGLAAMDFFRPSGQTSGRTPATLTGLRAKKAWFCFDREIVCLGAGITAPTDQYPVQTSINQCLLHGDVLTSDGKETRTIGKGEQVLEHPAWVLHDGVGYIFPHATGVHLKNMAQTGSWADIGAGAATPITTEVFSLWLDHGTRVADVDYEYRLAPGMTADQLTAYLQKPEQVTLSNTASLQAVSAGSLLMAAFYSPGTVTVQPDLTITVDHACLLIADCTHDGATVTAANPENASLLLHVEVSRLLAGPGAEILPNNRTTRLTLALPDGAEAGKSVTSRYQTVREL